MLADNAGPICISRGPDEDHTTLDVGEPEAFTIMQTDEYGQLHQLVLSPRMADRLMHHLAQWKSQT